MKARYKIHNKWDWVQFATGYLNLSGLACREILDKKFNDENYSIEKIYLPAIFNLKHGIEILLKTLSITFLNKEFLTESDYSHDLEEIFSRLRKEVKEDRLKIGIRKYEERFPDQKGKLDGKSIFDELEKLILKYQRMSILKDKIGDDFIINDYDNTALKYQLIV